MTDFTKMLAKQKGEPKKKMAEGGEVESASEVGAELKLAAYEVMDAMGTGFGGDGDRAEKVAKALKAFFLIVDAEPHKEGGE
jgi:hypothetical protein